MIVRPTATPACVESNTTHLDPARDVESFIVIMPRVRSVITCDRRFERCPLQHEYKATARMHVTGIRHHFTDQLTDAEAKVMVRVLELVRANLDNGQA